MNAKEIRDRFPALQRSVHGRPWVYLDNAATSQRLQAVLDCWMEMNIQKNANIHRAVHTVAVEATEAFESTRDFVASLLHASREEIVFTSGATASLNLVATCFGEAFIGEGDEILVSEAEHHSNLVPWQMLCARKKAVLKPVRIENSGALLPDTLEKCISERTKIVAISHISNVLGIINPVKDLVAVCHRKGIPVLVDGAQGMVHQAVDVTDLDCDFYVFSGHKLFAATGTGVLYGKKKWLDRMPPYMGGGEMIETVRFSGTTYAAAPGRFEAGTQNIASIPTLVPALDFLHAVQQDAEAVSEQQALTAYMLDALQSDERIRLYGVPRRTEEKIPLFSFTVTGAHHEDLALILDKMGIAVRSGQMCAEPLMDRFGVTGMLRASFAPYNTMEEAEYFMQSLNKAIKMLV